MLQGAVVKGGSGLKFRYGLARTRATMDLDAACRGDIAQFAETLGRRLAEGWCGFTGVVTKRPPATPRDVPVRYVMQPYAVRRMQPWPPRVEKGVDWEETYEAANVRHGVPRSLDEAVAWANELVGRLDDACRERPASSAP